MNRYAQESLKNSLRTLRITYGYALLCWLIEQRVSKPSIAGTIWVAEIMREWRAAHPQAASEPIAQAASIPESEKTQTTRPHVLQDVSISVSLPRIHFPDFSALRHLLGTTLLVSSAVLILIFTAPIAALEVRGLVLRLTQPFMPAAEQLAQGSIIEEQAPTIQPTPEPTPPPKDQRFHIQIPSIGVDSNVMPNVDAGNQAEYEAALKQGVAHAQGTGFPGDDGGKNKTIFIFAHSTNGSWNITRYNALFYSLKDMEPGQQITVWFWGKPFTYAVTEKRVVDADDVSFLEPQMEKEKLILQTCWPPGTTWKRLLVIAEPVAALEGTGQFGVQPTAQ